MTRSLYDWQRYLVPSSGSIDLDSNGFLRDPDEGFGALSNPDLLKHADLSDIAVIVVLGEPGMGKSTLLKQMELRSSAAGRTPINIDLSASGSEERLHRRLTQSDITSAGVSAPPADLFIDAFDTGLLSIPTLSHLLTEVFNEYPETAELHIRLTCRNQVWPPILQEALESKWGKDNVKVVEMAPLCRRDAALAAEQEGLDPEGFLRQVEAHHAGVLAARPVTLLFLLRLARQHAPFPKTRVELYRQGCELLCGEANNTRQVSGRVGNRAPAERMLIAARIAAVLLICNRESVWRGSAVEFDPARDTSVNDLVGSVLGPDGSPIQLTQQDLLETLDTGLFWLRGLQRAHFVHQSYGEFLAALYLHDQGMPADRKLALLSDAANGGLIPQLLEVAAWSAALDPTLFELLLDVHAPALITSDAAMAAPERRAALIEKLLQLADRAEWVDDQWGIRRHYRQLCHPEIATQLAPWIKDRSHFIVARRVALDIAVACELTELQDLLLRVALDASDENGIRGQAVDTIAKIGDRTHRRRLSPLLELPPEQDPSDEIRGNAMMAMWPDCIDLPTLLPHLHRRHDPNHIGSYWRFLTEELPKSLTDSDLVRALRWACELISDLDPRDDRLRIAQAIAGRGLDFLSSADASRTASEPLQELTNLLLRLRSRAYEATSSSATRDAAHPLRNQAQRQRLLPFLLRRVQNIDHSAYLLASALHGEPAFVQTDDVLWLLELAQAASSPTTCWTLCRLVWRACRSEQQQSVYAACMEHPVMRRAIPELTGTIWLTSTRLRRIRDDEAVRQRFQRRMQLPPPDPPPQQRIAATLSRIEQGEIGEFLRLAIYDLALSDDGRYERSTSIDLRGSPGWQQADESTRARIVSAASTYLLKGESLLDRLLEAGNPIVATDVAVAALFLVEHEDPDAMHNIASIVLARWAPAFLPCFLHPGKDEQDWATQLLRRAYEAVPNEIQEAVQRHLDRDIELDKLPRTTHGLEPIWDTKITAVVLRAAKATRAAPETFASLFWDLMRNAPDTALGYGLQLIAALPEQPNEPERQNAVRVARSLVRGDTARAWPILWQTIERDTAFGRSLILKLADDWDADGDWWTNLNDTDLGRLSHWVEQEFPLQDRQRAPRSRRTLAAPDRTWDLDRLRSRLLESLIDRGTRESVVAIDNIAAMRPSTHSARRLKVRARESLRKTSWHPPSPSELLLLAGDNQKRLVRDGSELLNLVSESLARLQSRLTEGWNPLVRCLWNECKHNKPKDENFLSDFVCDHLNRDLRGVAALREVEARNRRGRGVGERTDILVSATAKTGLGTAESSSVVIECKGCWNSGLKTAMDKQLRQQYLIDEDHRFGLYLVGWFQCDAWNDKGDSRRRRVPSWSLQEATNELANQARELSNVEAKLQAVVLDLRLPGG